MKMSMNYCRKICNKKGKIDLYMDKDWFYEQYVTLEKSLVEIGEIYDVYDSEIYDVYDSMMVAQ